MTDDEILPDYECIDCKSRTNNSTLDDLSSEFMKENPNDRSESIGCYYENLTCMANNPTRRRKFVIQ